MKTKKRSFAVMLSAVAALTLVGPPPAQAASRPSDCHVRSSSTSSSGGARYYTVTAWCNQIPAGTRIRARIMWYGSDPVSAWTSVPGRQRTVSSQMYSWQYDGGTYQVGYY